MSNILNIRMINARYYLIIVQMLILIFMQELKVIFLTPSGSSDSGTIL